MPELTLTEEQLDRIQTVREDLETAYVGAYGHVRPRDAIEYLLDTYTPPEEFDDAGAVENDDSGSEADAAGETEPDDELPGEGSTESSDGGTTDPESTLQQAMSLLDAHDGKWREGSGDEPYEVDLPDGSTEPARTQDDVRRLLFKHYR